MLIHFNELIHLQEHTFLPLKIVLQYKRVKLT